MKKNVQIPLQVFLTLNYLLHHLDASGLREEDIKAFEELKEFFKEKSSRLRNEVAYTDYIRSPREGKEKALDDYIATRKLKF